MIVKEEDKEKLTKTRKLLWDDDKIHLFLPYVLEKGASMDEPITVERPVTKTRYYLEKDGAILDSISANSKIILDEVLTGKKIMVLLHLAIPEKNSRGEDQFPSELLVNTHEAFLLNIRTTDVDTEFLEMDPYDIIGVKFNKLKITDIDAAGNPTGLDVSYECHFMNNTTEEKDFNTADAVE